MSKEQFQLKYREYMEEGGHSYDPWDLAAAWSRYQENPAAYDYLTEEKSL